MQCSRSRLLWTVAGILVAALIQWGGAVKMAGAAGEGNPDEDSKMKQARKEAAHRRRRIIYNDDGCGPIWKKDSGNTPERFLFGPHSRMGAVRGTQVDSVFICSGATTVLNHTSSVAESYADIEDRYGPFGGDFEHFRDNMRALEALGTDAIRLTVDFCRKHKIEVFYSYRVNDVHDTYDWCAVERSTWKREHPQYMMSTKEEGDKHAESDAKRMWSFLDFEIPEVREYLLSILDDVANRYDLDGMEIDYFRSPLFFRPNLELKPATKAQLDVLTGFQGRVRQIALRAGAKRGRPMLVAARVPMTVAMCKHVGIDIERWLADDLLDVLPTGGGYVPFIMPTGELVKLGHRYQVPVYPTISGSSMRGGEGYDSIEAWRGAAASAWRAGADGVYIFNYFPNKPGPQFMELGDPQKLATMDKLFVIDNGAGSYTWGGHAQAIPSADVLPVEVPGDGSVRTVRLPVGDDLPSAATKGTLDGVMMTIQLSDPAILAGVEIKLNDRLLTPAATDAKKGRLSFQLDPSGCRVGDNRVSIRVTSPTKDGKSPAKLAAVELRVKYRN